MSSKSTSKRIELLRTTTFFYECSADSQLRCDVVQSSKDIERLGDEAS